MQVNRGRLEHKASKVDTPFDPSSVKIVDLIGMPHAVTEELRDYVSSSSTRSTSPIATSRL
jgi:hypothetical protein